MKRLFATVHLVTVFPPGLKKEEVDFVDGQNVAIEFRSMQVA